MPRFPGFKFAVLCAASAVAAGQASAVTCSVTPLGIQFGAYEPFGVADTVAASSVTVTCTGLVGLFVSYELSLSAGGSGSVFDRTMTHGGASSDTLDYQIYTNALRTIVWGDGVSGATISGGYLLVVGGSVAVEPYYGTIPAGQVVTNGSYSDELVVTVTF